jgi:hypothetical protein
VIERRWRPGAVMLDQDDALAHWMLRHSKPPWDCTEPATTEPAPITHEPDNTEPGLNAPNPDPADDEVQIEFGGWIRVRRK